MRLRVLIILVLVILLAGAAFSIPQNPKFNLTFPAGIARNTDYYYVSQKSPSNSICKYDPFKANPILFLSADDIGIMDPADLLLSGSLLYVVDKGHDRVLRYSGDDFMDSFDLSAEGGLSEPTYLNQTVSGEELLLTDHGHQKVWILSGSGNVRSTLSHSSLSNPRGAAGFEREDGARVYLIADGSGKIVRFTYEEDNGGPIEVWNDFRSKLIESNLEGALQNVHPLFKNATESLWNSLSVSGRLSEFCGDLPTGEQLVPVSNNGMKATFHIIKNVSIPGTYEGPAAFPVIFVKSIDGKWRVLEF